MNKILIGILVGAVLGAFDGATAWFTPEVRNAIVGIMIGSTIKGIIAGAAAGWFAKKVNSIPAGIAFGLAIGAILAFIVCQLQGGKYYLEIMLPGSLVGAIAGWATQRYGRPSMRSAAAMLGAALLLVTFNAHAGEQITAAEAFAKLKALDGTWSGHVMKEDGPPTTVQYRVRSGGSVVEETLFGGTPHEMFTIYSVDGDKLLATHYCSGGNQPTMKLNLAKSTPAQLVFEFDALHGTGDHIHNGTIRFDSADKVVADWRWVDSSDKETGPPKLFYLSRAK
jgi:hypothetical protein